MGDAIDNLIALAGTERVGSYYRTSKSGKRVKVSAHTRGSRMSVDVADLKPGDVVNNGGVSMTVKRSRGVLPGKGIVYTVDDNGSERDWYTMRKAGKIEVVRPDDAPKESPIDTKGYHKANETPDSPFSGGGGVGDLNAKTDKADAEHYEKVRASEDKMKSEYEQYMEHIKAGKSPEEAKAAVYGAPKSEGEKKSDFKPTTATSKGKGPVSDPKVVEFAASRKKGVNASDLAYEMRISNESAMRRLMQQVEAGKLTKKGSKFVALSAESVEGYIALSREV